MWRTYGVTMTCSSGWRTTETTRPVVSPRVRRQRLPAARIRCISTRAPTSTWSNKRTTSRFRMRMQPCESGTRAARCRDNRGCRCSVAWCRPTRVGCDPPRDRSARGSGSAPNRGPDRRAELRRVDLARWTAADEYGVERTPGADLCADHVPSTRCTLAAHFLARPVLRRGDATLERRFASGAKA